MDFEEIGSNISEKVKNIGKNKPFLLACVAVGVVGLLVWYRRQNSSTSDDSGTLYYSSYPTTGGGGDGGYSDSDLESEYNSQLSAMADEYNSQLSTMQDDFSAQLAEQQNYYDSVIDSIYSDYAATTDELQTNIADLGDQLRTASEVNDSLVQRSNYQTLISQMRANSELYNNISDPTQKAALHNANLAIADELGLTYDSSVGGYVDSSGQYAYTTGLYDAKQLSGYYSGGTAANTGTVNYDPNVNYNGEIAKAILSGASGSAIDALNDQRNAKIAGTGTTLAIANSGYDKNTDYSELITKAKAAGASQAVIDNLTAARNAKIAGEGLTQYATSGTGGSSATTINTNLFQRSSGTISSGSSGSSGSSSKVSGTSSGSSGSSGSSKSSGISGRVVS